jgi:hypothetical protein
MWRSRTLVSWGGPEAESINQAAFIYSARNLAVGFAFIIVFALKNGPMLFILIFIRLFTDLIDLPTLLYFGLSSNVGRVGAIFVFITSLRSSPCAISGTR